MKYFIEKRNGDYSVKENDADFSLLLDTNAVLRLIVIDEAASDEMQQTFRLKLAPDSRLEIIQFVFGKRATKIGVNADLDQAAQLSLRTTTGFSEDGKLNYSYHALHSAKSSKSDFQMKSFLVDNATKNAKMQTTFEASAHSAVGAEFDNTLLLSENAKNTVSPIIVCKTDDVDGKHGMSSGHIDENAMQYLLARGLNPAQIKQIYAHSFISAALRNINDSEALEYINKVARKYENFIR